MRPRRAAVIGTGFIGPVHVEALRRAGMEVAAMIGSTPTKTQAAHQRWGISSLHTTLEQVLADPTIDAVHLTTPNQLHYAQVQAVLRAGKHVICEKPLAVDSRQSAELVKLAAESGCAAAVAYNIRFYPLCHEARARIRQGSVGQILHVTGSYVQDWLLKDTDFNWRVLAEEGGALRAVADIGTHWLDLVQFITGRQIVAVCADLQTVHPHRQRPIGGRETFAGQTALPCPTEPVPITTDDAGGILLRFDNGARGVLWVSQSTAGHKNCLRFEISGSQRTLAWNSQSPNDLWIGNRDAANESLIRDPALLHEDAAGITHYPGGHNEGFPDTFKQLFRSFYEYVRRGDFTAQAPFPTFAEGHQEILLCEAILQSHHQRGWVTVYA
jgi:predicted dehydrogenase